MTDLYDQYAPDAVTLFIAWLLPLGPIWAKRPASSAFPHGIVTRIAGSPDENLFCDEAVLSIHWIGQTYEQARDASREGDRRIDLLSSNLEAVTLPDGSVISPDFVDTLQKPIHVEYGDTGLERFVARYRVALSYVTD